MQAHTGARWGKEELASCPTPLTQLSVNCLWNQGSATLGFISFFLSHYSAVFAKRWVLHGWGRQDESRQPHTATHSPSHFSSTWSVWQVVTLRKPVGAVQLWARELRGVRVKGQTGGWSKALDRSPAILILYFSKGLKELAKHTIFSATNNTGLQLFQNFFVFLYTSPWACKTWKFYVLPLLLQKHKCLTKLYVICCISWISNAL